MPLGEAVPGFEDVITMAVAGGVWGEEVDIVRWLPSRAAPEIIRSFRNDSPDEGGWFAGLDAAGTWYAFQDERDMLSVRPVAATAQQDWWEPEPGVVGLRVVGSAWHNTVPGQLAWLSCPRTQSGTGTLYTLDVTDVAAEPLALVRLPEACGEFPLWFGQWGNWGFALERMGFGAAEDVWEEPDTWTILLDPDGNELAGIKHGPGGADMVAAGPVGTVWNEEPIDGPPTSFVLSLDGRHRTPVPGLAEDEWIDEAEWCPDGSRIALVASSALSDRPLLRIVAAATGETTAEIDELGADVFQTRWSSDGRYLLVAHDRDAYGAAGAALTWYDTVSAAIAIEDPFREVHYFSEVRTFEPSSIDMQFTPVEWDIGLDEGWGPGVYTVRISAEASPLLPDQIEALSGKLVWDKAIVALCYIGIDHVGGGYVQIGDGFQTIEGCGANPNAMQEAFDRFGLPELACLVVTAGGVDHEYCAPLT